MAEDWKADDRFYIPHHMTGIGAPPSEALVYLDYRQASMLFEVLQHSLWQEGTPSINTSICYRLMIDRDNVTFGTLKHGDKNRMACEVPHTHPEECEHSVCEPKDPLNVAGQWVCEECQEDVDCSPGKPA